MSKLILARSCPDAQPHTSQQPAEKQAMLRFAEITPRTSPQGVHSSLSQPRVRLRIEHGAIRPIGWRGPLSKGFPDMDSWQKTLPWQSARRIPIPGVQLLDLEALHDHVA